MLEIKDYKSNIKKVTTAWEMEYLTESENEEEKQDDARPNNSHRSIVLERSQESAQETSFTPSNN